MSAKREKTGHNPPPRPPGVAPATPAAGPPAPAAAPTAPPAPGVAPAPPAPDALAAPAGRLSRALDVIEPFLLVLVLAVLVISALVRFKQTGLLSAIVVVAALIPFFLRFEDRRIKPRDIMPIVVMAAIAVALRIIMVALPMGITAVSAVIIITGVGFGRRSGFMTGVLVALVSNLFLGQGPWTPWQMYSWGAMGYLAGVLGTHAWFCRRWLVVLFGGLAAEGYGLILDTYSAFSFFNISGNAAIGAVYVAGFFYNLSHVISTVVFLWLIYNLWMSQLTRIKLKYGIGEKT